MRLSVAKSGLRDAGERALTAMACARRYNLWLYERFEPRLGAAVVELGSGVGNFSRFLLDRERVVLTDADPAYVEALARAYRGRERVEVRRLELGGAAGGGEGLEGAFDAAIALNVLEHVEGDAAAVRSVAALLKPGGRAVFLVPAHRALFGSMDEALGHVRRYDKEGLRALLEGAGLETVELRYLNPLAVPGWLLNGRVLRRRGIPRLQLSLFDRLVFLLSPLERLGLPFGLSVFAVALRPGEEHGR